ncbi:TatD family hydrolase [Azonexus sp.]|uniref:TatD family hydrolase n=1 Tax=Azonexus sp. TaxID=1872668 RepID=UPI0035B1E260
MLVDSHCHLDFPGLNERLPEVLATMREAGVGAAMTIGVNLEDLPAVLAVAEQADNLYASVGVHPEYTDCQEPDAATLVTLAQHPKVLAIGETGLDYYWHKDRPEWQRQRFRTHIQAARACGKPLVVHTRESAEDTIRLLREEGAEAVGGVMHCFTENWEIASQALDIGFYLSFSGIVTFKNAAVVKEVASRCPLDRLLVETDAPYLAPAPFRGKPNQPAYVRYVAEEIARLRDLSPAAVAAASTENFIRLFRPGFPERWS